jgi:reverse transcriptase-like protein
MDAVIGPTLDVAAALADRRRYEHRIERLHQRHLLTGRLYDLRQDGVPLASLVMDRARVARLLARDVSRGDYALTPGEMRTIRARGKLREVYSCGLTDLIVHGVVADIVGEATAPALSARVFSYRPGTSWAQPVAEFAAWVRAVRRAQPDPRRRGVYVLRGDVDSYTDSIPLTAASPLWPMLDAHLGRPLHPLVGDVVRTVIRMPGGGLACRVRGLPMGQPIAPVLANLYLGRLDAALAAVPGAFYARYGDDFLFAHPRAEVARAAARHVDVVLGGLAMTVNARKRQTLYLTPPGRPSTAWPAATGAPEVHFLGTRIRADGTVGLDRAKVRAVLREVDRRATATAATLRPAPPAEIGRAVCAAVNSALAPGAALAEQRSAGLLRHVVTDRAQLAQLDHRIAGIVASAVTGRPGPRAFREVPYRRLRAEWGLRSLVVARNAQGRAR